MWRPSYIIWLCSCFILGSYATSYYTIIGSKIIQANSDYPVAVTLKDAAGPCTFKVDIQNDNSYKLSQKVKLRPNSTRLVKFSIGSLPQGNYKLVATGEKGIDFNNETTINLQTKYQSVFVQTDKAMYKPGDKVQFRVLVLDTNLNPAQITKMNVYIKDAAQNRIKQWLNVATVMGVYTQDLQLAATPTLGTWTINVDVNDETSTKNFEIAEYVLPKFGVDVTAPTDSTYSDGVLRILVNAKYTYGANVQGVAEVTVSAPFYPWMAPATPTNVRKQVDINGKVYVEFQIQSELKVNQQNGQSQFDVTAVVTEALTGKSFNASTTAIIRENKFQITNLEKDYSFTPGPYKLVLQFTKFDDSPFIDTVNPIRVSYGLNYDQTNSTVLGSGKMNSKGLAEIPVTLPNESAFNIFIKFLNFNNSVGYYYKAEPSTTQSLSVKLLSQNIKVNQNIKIGITSTNDVSSINYLVTSRGKLILSASKKIPNGKSITITLKSSFAMVPTVQFVAYYLAANGDIVSGNIGIPVTGLNNFVKLGTSAPQKQPGEKVDITINTKPSSQVCMLGIDQSVALLKTGNDIKQSDVYADLEAYNIVNNFNSGPMIRGGPVLREKRFSIMPWPGGNGGWADFNTANLFVLSNANEPPMIYPMMYERMDMAMAAGGMQESAPRVRKYFPETWIWNCTDSSSGNLTLPQVAPDTITSWYLTAFATNNNCGLGITDDKTIFKVFKSFFISLNLPYSVKRGETISLSIVVFNYLSQDVTAQVTLDNSLRQFEFIDPHTQVLKSKGCPPENDLSRNKTVNVKSNNGAQLSFLITPLITGSITIKVTAISPLAGDAIEMPLLVVPEGVTQFKNKAQFVDLRETAEYTTKLTVDVPSNAVSNSTKVSFSVIGDIMGVALQNIQALIQMPSGCGEQTMIGLAPDVAIYTYLTSTGLLTSALKTLLIKYMEIGYQSELTYIHLDGSVSAFGMSDPSGSSWLTAFVARIFIQASKFITIDDAVIVKALEWLKSLQQTDGSFAEPGKVIHSDMQGEATKGVPLTAYIAISFAIDKTYAQQYADVITKALDYVTETINKGPDDVYSLAVACYAAQLANHKSKDALLQKLDTLAKTKDDQKWWQKIVLANPSDYWCSPPSVNVEITGYALLSYISAGRVIDGLPIVRWMLSQQSQSGGFGSTQDTVVGIAALAAFATQISEANSMSCAITYGTSSSTLNIDKTNSLVLQSVVLPDDTKEVTLLCTGSGFSLVQLSYQFNLNYGETAPRFLLDVEVDKASTDYNLVLNVCTSFIAGTDGNASNMALIEAELPTGFSADLQTIQSSVGEMKSVKKVETKNSNTVVVVYLDSVTTTKICLQITAYRLCQVADEKPVAVMAIDYYDNSRRKTTFYQRTPQNVCAICNDDNCKAACQISSKDVKCPKKK